MWTGLRESRGIKLDGGGKMLDRVLLNREEKRERKQRFILSSGLSGFHTGDAMESDTSTRHKHNALALILISVFLVGG